MPRPWIESAVLIAAHGRVVPLRPRRKGPVMSDDIRFALIPRLDPDVRPIACADADALARAIQRRRALRSIEMVEHDDLELPGRPGPTRGVEVWALDAGNDRDERIGYAFIDGAGMEALRAALRRNPAVASADDNATRAA